MLFPPGLSRFVANLLCLDLLQDIIMSSALDEVFQVDLAIFILQVQAPARSSVDIRPIDWLPITDDSVQTRFGELARSVTLVVFKFGERVQEVAASWMTPQPSKRGLMRATLQRPAVPFDPTPVEVMRDRTVAASTSSWRTTRNRVTRICPKTESSSTVMMRRMSRPTLNE